MPVQTWAKEYRFEPIYRIEHAIEDDNEVVPMDATYYAMDNVPFYQVPGNCDRYRCPPFAREILSLPAGGVRLYMTHGHIHKVKQTPGLLLRDARESGAAAALYGHTHVADCHREEDGLWVLNPGSCGSWSGSVGLIEICDEKIIACRILRQADLEEML